MDTPSSVSRVNSCPISMRLLWSPHFQQPVMWVNPSRISHRKLAFDSTITHAPFIRRPRSPAFPVRLRLFLPLKTHPLIYRMTHGADDFWSSLTGRRRAFPLAIRRRSPPTHPRTAEEVAHCRAWLMPRPSKRHPLACRRLTSRSAPAPPLCRGPKKAPRPRSAQPGNERSERRMAPQAHCLCPQRSQPPPAASPSLPVS